MIYAKSTQQTNRPPQKNSGQKFYRRNSAGHKPTQHTTTQQTPSSPHSKPESKKLRVMVLGGLEEVGCNCTLFEYGNDIIIVDMGLQFPEEDMPGIDYIIPNISYLKGKEKNIRGVVITHAHYDHIVVFPTLFQHLVIHQFLDYP